MSRNQTNCHICKRITDKYYTDICYKCEKQCCSGDRTIVLNQTVCYSCIKKWFKTKGELK